MQKLISIAILLLLGASAVTAQGSLPPPNAPFGRSMLQYFMMAPGYKNFNHGSFGATPQFVYEYQQRVTHEMEARPGAN